MAHALDEAEGGTSVLAPRPPVLRRAARPPRAGGAPPPPPGGRDGHGGGGGGGGGGGDEPGGPEDVPRGDVAELGLTLALIGIATLFAVFLFVWFLVRQHAPAWPLTVPKAAWAGTGLLFCSSIALESARTHHGRRACRALGLALLFGLGFLGAQALFWYRLSSSGVLPSSSGYGTLFYALTGLHALHVLAGLGVLSWLLVRGLASGVLPPGRLRLGARYWHSMAAIWIVLFAVLCVSE